MSETFVAAVEHHAKIASTNDRACEAANQNPELPLLVVADEQTAGRGRGSNAWWTGHDNLAMSVLLDPAHLALARELVPRVSLAAAVAVIQAVGPRLAGIAQRGIRLGLHWPNDVFADERKLGGILSQSLADGRLIIGIGLNVNNTLRNAPAEVRRSGTSMRLLTGRAHERIDMAVDLLNHLAGTLDQLSRAPDDFGRQFNRLCLQHGQTLSVRNGQSVVSGRCEEIATDGALVLATNSGTRHVYSGSLIK